MTKTEKIIQQLNLAPHPEGGYFRETYRSKGLVEQKNLGPNFQGDRNFSTCIYFLLTADRFSSFHKVNQDEIWHFYDGSPLLLHQIDPKGNYSVIHIGREIEKGQTPQYVVQGNTWFAAEVVNPDDYTLVGCTVAPGFDFRDFKLANRDKLIETFPQHFQIITRLTRN